MGQFHSDFEMDGAKDDPTAISSIFLGKKCYCDKLKAHDKNGNVIYGYHFRMKGVPSDCIEYKADEDFKNDLIKLYEELFDYQDGINFDMLACHPKFQFNKDMTINSRSKFKRLIKFINNEKIVY